MAKQEKIGSCLVVRLTNSLEPYHHFAVCDNCDSKVRILQSHPSEQANGELIGEVPCPHCGETSLRKVFLIIEENMMNGHIHGRNPKTGRSYIGEYIDRQKPILF